MYRDLEKRRKWLEEHREELKAYHKKRYEDNKEEMKRQAREHREKNKDEINAKRRAFLKTAEGKKKLQVLNIEKSGLTYERYKEELEKQHGSCAICGEKGKEKRLVIDHDHTTMLFRGLLCNNCNTMIGLSKDNTETLKAAIRYIEESKIVKENSVTVSAKWAEDNDKKKRKKTI